MGTATTGLAPVKLRLPQTRAECVNGPRPCPHVTCRHHAQAGEAHPVPGACTLDVAQSGPATLEEVGATLGFTKEWVSQIEERALRKLRQIARGQTPDRLDPKAGRKRQYERVTLQEIAHLRDSCPPVQPQGDLLDPKAAELWRRRLRLEELVRLREEFDPQDEKLAQAWDETVEIAWDTLSEIGSDWGPTADVANDVCEDEEPSTGEAEEWGEWQQYSSRTREEPDVEAEFSDRMWRAYLRATPESEPLSVAEIEASFPYEETAPGRSADQLDTAGAGDDLHSAA